MKFGAFSLKILVIISFLLCFTTYLNATIIYDESSSGDLSSERGSPEFDFGIGINTILGSDAIGDNLYDLDQFLFNISPGTQLVSVTYSFGNLNLFGSISNVHSDYRLRDEAASYITTENTIQILTSSSQPGASPVSLFEDVLSLGEGSYNWMNSGYGWGGSSSTDDNVSWDYIIDFQVAALNTVPEPATMMLFGIGLLGLTGVSRRKK